MTNEGVANRFFEVIEDLEEALVKRCVALSTVGRPRYVELLVAGFLAFLIADTWYLKLRSAGPYESGNWPEPFWASSY